MGTYIVAYTLEFITIPSTSVPLDVLVEGPTATLTWWNLPSGGTQISTGTSFNPDGQTGEEGTTVNTNTSGTYTFYVSETCDDGSTSERIAVTLIIESMELPEVEEPDLTICTGETIPMFMADTMGVCELEQTQGPTSTITFQTSNNVDFMGGDLPSVPSKCTIIKNP